MLKVWKCRHQFLWMGGNGNPTFQFLFPLSSPQVAFGKKTDTGYWMQRKGEGGDVRTWWMEKAIQNRKFLWYSYFFFNPQRYLKWENRFLCSRPTQGYTYQFFLLFFWTRIETREKGKRKIAVVNSTNLCLQANKFEWSQKEGFGKIIYLKVVMYSNVLFRKLNSKSFCFKWTWRMRRLCTNIWYFEVLVVSKRM